MQRETQTQEQKQLQQDKQKKCFLITRPLSDSIPLSKEINQLGFNNLIEPLLNINFYKDVNITPKDYDILLITSTNGLRSLAQIDNFKSFLKKKIYTVGSASAKEARNYGFNKIIKAGGDVEKLVTTVTNSENINPQQKFLHISGEVTASDLSSLLRQKGFDVERKILYEAQKVQYFSSKAIEFIKSGKISGVLLFSPRTTEIFYQLTLKHDLEKFMKNITAHCLSSKVANKCESIKFKKIYAANHPTQKSLIATLKKI